MVSKSSCRPAQPLLSPVQGRPRGKHKATNPQAVELAGKQILLLLLQACAGVIANQNLPWLQTRSSSANAMVKKRGDHQGGGAARQCIPRQAELLQPGLPAIRAFEPPVFPPKNLDLKMRKRDKAQMAVGS